MAPSNPSLSSLLFCLLILHHRTFAFPFAVADVEDTCRTVAARNHNINYDFCVSNFLRHPKSGEADTRGLASIAALISITNSYNVKYDIEQLLKKPQDPATRTSLCRCMLLYRKMLLTLASAVDSINYHQDHAAKDYLKLAINDAGVCESQFARRHNPSPLTRGNKNSVLLSTMSLVIIDLIKH